MTRKRSVNRAWGLLAVCALALALALAGIPALGLSDGAALPPRPTDTSTPLPPTPTPTVTPRPIRPAPPTPRPRPTEDAAPTGAEIELLTAHPGVYTVVQWQDTAGRWHDVEGWRGTTEAGADGLGTKVWWLSESLLGQGPFRWLLCSAPDGDTTAASAPFYLPDELGERLTITIP